MTQKLISKIAVSSLAVAGVFAGAGAASAATISGGSFNDNPLDFLQPTEINQTGILNKFNTSLGNLQKAIFTFNGAANTKITLTNNASTQQNVSATSLVNLSFTSASTPLGDVAVTLPTGTQTITSGGTFSSPLIEDTESKEFTFITGSFFESLKGAGTFNVSCTSLSGITILGGGGQIDSTQTSNAGCGASVVYEYDPPVTQDTPEPASLLGLGLIGGLGLLAKRKNS